MTTLADAPVITVHLPKLYPKQRAAFFNDSRISACEASTKAGKSVGGLAWQMDQCLRVRPGMAHLWIEPVHTQAKVMFERVLRWMAKADPSQIIWSANKTDMIVSFSNGSRWFFKGSENYDTIYGSDYGSAVIDEASRCREEVWAAVRSTVTATNGQIRTIGNVKGRKNWNYRLCRKAEGGEIGYSYHKLTVYDAVAAGVIKVNQIEEAKRDLPEHVFRELYLAEASDDGSNPFGMAHIEACVGIGGADPNVVAWGVDLAKSHDWTVAIGLNGEGEAVVIERWQGPWGETTTRLARMIGSTPALVDSTGVGDPIVEQLQRTCPDVEGRKFTSMSKQQMMEGLAVAIQNRSIHYPDGVLRSELESFEYEHTGRGVRYSAPEGCHDDCVCALALAVQKWDSVGHTGTFEVFSVSPKDEAMSQDEAVWFTVDGGRSF